MKRFPKCQCGHNFSDHHIGGWCRKCAKTLNIGCEFYFPWKPKIFLRSYAYPDWKEEQKMAYLEELETNKGFYKNENSNRRI